jgi:hypothetical protein
LYTAPLFTQQHYLQQVQVFQQQRAQLLAHLQEQSAEEHRQLLASRIQADLLARARSDRNTAPRPAALNDTEYRPDGAAAGSTKKQTIPSGAVLGDVSAPTSELLSPAAAHTVGATKPPHIKSTTSGTGSTLAALLSRRQLSDDSIETRSTTLSTTNIPRSSETVPPSPTSTTSALKYTGSKAVGNGRPTQLASSSALRVSSLPTPITTRIPPAPRAVSATVTANVNIVKVKVLRQPIGPPGEAKDLAQRNFQGR